MAGSIDAVLAARGIVLPAVTSAVGNYVPFVVDHGVVTISGQVPMVDGVVRHKGKLGVDLDVAQGAAAARVCALNVVAQLRAACGGDLDRVERCIRIAGYVASSSDFVDHPKVINGASDLIGEIFGDRGRHARAAVGCPSLPLGAAVEVEATFRLKP
ncbi:MAG: RidA family protein [Alphaproteobacteria bacterium]